MKKTPTELSHYSPGPGHFRSAGPLGSMFMTDQTLRRRSESNIITSVPLTKNEIASKPAWRELEEILTTIYNFVHNKRELADRKPPKTPEQAVREKLAEIRDGSDGEIKKTVFRGPKVFLRVSGKDKNRIYTGDWWFDMELLSTLERSYSRIYVNDSDKRQVIRDMLREFLAISTGWNAIEEIWALELPPGDEIAGFESKVARQKLLNDLPLSAKGNRILVGQANQIFFPVKNPLWITRYRDLTP